MWPTCLLENSGIIKLNGQIYPGLAQPRPAWTTDLGLIKILNSKQTDKEIATLQSWKKLHVAHTVRADIFSELRTFGFRNYAHMLRLQICVVILIYLEVNTEE